MFKIKFCLRLMKLTLIAVYMTVDALWTKLFKLKKFFFNNNYLPREEEPIVDGVCHPIIVVSSGA